jgi:hypothetical protein
MTLVERCSGRARLDAGWISIGMENGQGVSFRCDLGNGPPSAPPTWEEIDRRLADSGYTRKGPLPSAVPAEGVEFDVVGWVSDYRPRYSGGGEPDEEPGLLAVPLPLLRAGAIRQALDGLRDASPWYEDEIMSLMTRLDEAGPVTVLLSAHEASSLRSLVSKVEFLRREFNPGAVGALEDLQGSLESAFPVSGPWPHVRDTLQTALREALSRPGAEALAARDELLDLIVRFAEAHRTATATATATDDDREE